MMFGNVLARFLYINNEGREGYAPARVTLEKIEWANKILRGN